MMPNDTADPEYPLKYGERLDGHDLREVISHFSEL